MAWLLEMIGLIFNEPDHTNDEVFGLIEITNLINRKIRLNAI